MQYLLFSNLEWTNDNQLIVGICLVALLIGAAMAGMMGASDGQA